MGEEEGDDDEGDDDNDELSIKPSRNCLSANLLEEACRSNFEIILEAFSALLGPSWGPLGGGLLGQTWVS